MKYTVYCDNYPLYDLDKGLSIESPLAKLKKNTVGEFTFKIYPMHPYFDTIKKLLSVISVYKDSKLIFKGRALNDTQDFNNAQVITCEGKLACLNDSVVRPYTFADGVYDYTDSNNVYHNGFLKWLLENHNAQVTENQQIKLGTVSHNLDSNNYINRSSTDYANTWQVVEDKLLKTLGGVLVLRFENDGDYLDYLADSDLTATSTQQIEFGENLIDITQEVDGTETYTAIIPLGAKADTQSNTRLTISSIVDGDITSDVVKSGDTLYSRAGVAAHGKIYAPVANSTWDDVTLATNLITKGTQYLSSTAVMLKKTITLKAIDLAVTSKDIQSFNFLDCVIVNSTPHNLSGTYLLSEMDIPLDKPDGMTINLGDTRLTLADVTVNTQRDALDAGDRLTKIERNYVINSVVTNISTSLSSLIKQLPDQIISTVKSDKTIVTSYTYYAKSTSGADGALEVIESGTPTEAQILLLDVAPIELKDGETPVAIGDYVVLRTAADGYTSLIESVKSLVSQTASAFEVDFVTTSVTNAINNAVNAVDGKYSTYKNYLRFDAEGNLIIGKSENSLTLVEKNDRISFYNGNYEIGYWGVVNGVTKFYANDGQFGKSCTFGNVGFFPRANGHISLRAVE